MEIGTSRPHSTELANILGVYLKRRWKSSLCFTHFSMAAFLEGARESRLVGETVSGRD